MNQPSAAPAAAHSDGREFWEVWSEEVGRTPTAAIATEALPSVTKVETVVDRTPTVTERPIDLPQTEVRSYQAPAAGQVRLYLNLGRKDGVSAEEIAEILTSTGVVVPAAAIDTMNTHSYINVPSADGEKLCAGLVGRERNGRPILCEHARPPRRR